MPQPTLRTARLVLVPLSDEHPEHEVELDGDPDVMRYLDHGRPRTREQVAQAHRRRLVAAELVPGLGFWAGSVGEEFVGWWLLEPPSEDPQTQAPPGRQAELGYRLLRRHWRQGLASEGARELLRYAFQDLRLDRVFAQTMAVNAASRATMTALDMQHVRTFHADWDEPIAGAEHGEVEYALTRDQWLPGRG